MTRTGRMPEPTALGELYASASYAIRVMDDHSGLPPVLRDALEDVADALDRVDEEQRETGR